MISSLLTGTVQMHLQSYKKLLGLGSTGYQFVNTEAAAVVSRMTVPPSDVRKLAYDLLYTDLKAAGISQKFDGLYVFAAHDQQAALLNLASNDSATIVGGVDFLPDRGFQGDGTSGAIRTGKRYTDNGVKFSLSDCHFGGVIQDSNGTGTRNRVVVAGGLGANNIQINSTATNGSKYVIYDQATQTFTISTLTGHYTARRVGVNVSTMFRNATAVRIKTETSTRVPDATEFTCFATGDASGNLYLYSAHRQSAMYFGLSLTDAETTSLYLCLNRFLATVGAEAIVPAPTVVLSNASPTLATDAPAGTLVTDITGVPQGVTPVLTPSDGRFVIAGDATTGWKIVVGMSALSAGTVNFAVAATGAISALGALTVSVPTPSLTISPAAPSVSANAAAGTLVSNISNVPGGVTPTVTPNDGRLVIAGNASTGWKVVLGMSALSAGTLSFSVAATGANGVNGVLTVAQSSSFPAYTMAARQMAYGTSLPHDVMGMKTNQRRQMLTRKRLTLAANAPSLYGTFDNIWMGADGENVNISTLTILQHAYILADGSASKIVTFNNGASTTKVLEAGAIKIAHDPITPADLGLTSFNGVDIICQTQVEVSDTEASANLIMNAQLTGDDYGATFPVETAVITPPGIGIPAVQTGQVTVSALGGYTVSAIIGVHNGEVMGQDGDSISWGTGDLTYGTNRMTGMSRSGLNSADEKPVPTLRMGRPGTSMPGRLSATGGAMRRAYMPHINHYRENFAANDLSTSPAAGRNVSVYADKEKLWAESYSLMGASGRVTSVLPIPRTTNNSTNTPQPGWALGGEADLLRQKVLAGFAAGKIHSVVTANALRLSTDPTSSDYWLFKNVNMVSTDGTHLSVIGYLAFLPELRANTVRYATNDETVFTSGTVASDPFSDTTAVLVSSRPTASGHNWAPVMGSTAALTTTGAGRAYVSTSGGIKLSAKLSPRQFAELDIVVATSSNVEQGVILRNQPTQNSRYTMVYAPSTGLVKINSTVNNSVSNIASVAISDPGTAFTIRGEADGTTLRLLINGVEALTGTHGYLSNGSAGIISGATSTATTGRQYDGFRAGNLPAISSGTTPGTTDPGTTPTPTPTLALSPSTATIAENASAGTVIAAVSNVPSSVTPTVTPNDGRLVIAGDATNGWKVVTGMSALSAGSISYTVAATGANSATGTITVTAVTMRIATYGTSVPLVANNKKGGRLQRCTRKTVVFGADVPYITGTFDNYATQSTGDFAVAASVTILQHAVINPANGAQAKIVTFDNGASTTKVLGTDVATGIRIFHDRVYPADVYGPGVTMFRRGDRITLQTDALVADDKTYADMVYNCECAPLGDSSIEFTATGVPIAPGVGDIPVQTNQQGAGSGYTVSCIYGPHSDTAHINFGDSIAAGTGDNSYAPIRWGYSRAATNSYLTKPVPLLNLARHGTVMGDLFNTDLSVKATGALRMAYVVSGTFQQVSENWAANDLGQTPAQATYDNAVANKTRLYQILRARGCEWITSVAPTPRTTNGTTNTPTNAGWAKGGQADQLNQFLAAKLADGTINALVRSLSLRASTDPTSENYFIYKNLELTNDGTHFSPVGYLAVIAEHRAAILRGNTTNDEPTYSSTRMITDTFSTGAGGSVADRLTDSGATWVRQGTADLTVTPDGRAYARVNGYLWLKEARMGRNTYIERDTVVVSNTTTTQNLQTRRQPFADVFSGYNVSFNPSTLTVVISRVPQSGNWTTLAYTTLTDDAGIYSTIGSNYVFRFQSNGPYHSVFMGPKGGTLALVLQATDAVYMLGEVGTRDNNNATATTGRHLEEVRAGNLSPAISPGTTTDGSSLRTMSLAGDTYSADRSPSGTVVGAVMGLEANATVALVDSLGGAFAMVGNEIVVGPTPATTRQSRAVQVRKTVGGITRTDTVMIDGPVPVIAADNFSGTAGTALETRTTTTGAKQWTSSVTGLFAVDGGGVLKPTAQTSGAVATFDTGSLNHTVQVKVSTYAASTAIFSMGEVVACYANANNYWTARLDARYNRVILLQKQNGAEYNVAMYLLNMVSNELVDIGLRCEGEDIALMVNGKEVLWYSRGTPVAASTGVGIRVQAASTATDYATWRDFAVSTPCGIKIAWPKFDINTPATPEVPTGPEGSYDYGDANNPTIFQHPVTEKWIMSYSGYPTRGSGGDEIQHLCIARSDSPDGPWIKDANNPVMLADPTIDGKWAFNGGLVFSTISNLWVLTYGTSAGSEVAYATSPDLVTWTRRGKLFAKGTAGTWFQSGAFDSSLRVLEDGRIECVASAKENGGGFNFGRAFSSNGGLTWTIPNTAQFAADQRLLAVFGNGSLFHSIIGEPCYVSPPKEPQQILCTFDAQGLGLTNQPVSGRRVHASVSFDGGKTWRYRIIVRPVLPNTWLSGMTIDSHVFVRPDGLLGMYMGATTVATTSPLGGGIHIGGSKTATPFTSVGISSM